MAGKPGRSGGARSGAGRPKKEPQPVEIETINDPKLFLIALMNTPYADVRVRADAAKALLPYVHKKFGEEGKKEGRQNAAKQAGKGRFAPQVPPKLSVISK